MIDKETYHVCYQKDHIATRSVLNSPTRFGMHTNRPEFAIELVVTRKKNVKFYACHHGLSCVHIMHHSSNVNAQTHSWNQYGPFDNKNDRFVGDENSISQVSIWHIALYICMYISI